MVKLTTCWHLPDCGSIKEHVERVSAGARQWRPPLANIDHLLDLDSDESVKELAAALHDCDIPPAARFRGGRRKDDDMRGHVGDAKALLYALLAGRER